MTFSKALRAYAVLAITTITVLLMFNNIKTINKSIDDMNNLKLNLTSSEFFKLKTYIDRNTANLRIYIGDFQSDINDALIDRVQKHNFGHGQGMAKNPNQSLISMYCGDISSDLIFYDRLKRDTTVLVRSLNEANVVYIPLMLGSLAGQPDQAFENLFYNMTLWLEKNEKNFRNKTVMLIFSHLETWIHYNQDHRADQAFMDHSKNLHIFTIEESSYRRFNYSYSIMPYPSMTKFQLQPKQASYNYELNDNRLIDLFFTGNARQWNLYRQFIFDNIKIKTNTSFETFNKTYRAKTNSSELLSVIYHLGFNDHTNWIIASTWPEKVKTMLEAIDWKRNSKFCLEPYGDTHTRRSFWDSIMHGCIPVLFTRFLLPFQNQIDYDRFVIRIDIAAEKLVSEINYNELFGSYLKNTEWIQNARKYMTQIRQFIQYSWPYDGAYNVVNPTYKYDAYGMILAKIAESL